MHMIYAPFLMGLVILLTACEEDEPILSDNAAGESAISRRRKYSNWKQIWKWQSGKIFG